MGLADSSLSPNSKHGSYVLEKQHCCICILEDAMPNLDADSQDRILFQQLLAGLPDDCSRALRAIPEIKTTADAVSRARLLMTVSHQASVPTIASVNAGKDSQTAAIDTLQGHVMHLTEQMSSLVDRLDGLSVAAVARPQSSDERSIIRQQPSENGIGMVQGLQYIPTVFEAPGIHYGCNDRQNFLSKHKVRLDYSTDPVSIHVGGLAVTSRRGSSSNATPSYMYVASTAGGEKDEVEEIAIPKFGDEVEYDIPPAPAELRDLVKRFEVLFSTVPGSTTVAHHTIPTADHPPVRVPPRRVSAHYRTEVERQLTEMLNRNIIRVSSSPWLAPAVYVPKKSGEIRICIDYRELNKQTVNDAYPLPLPDEVQDRLSGSKVFSMLDLHSGYWQLPVKEEDCIKTAFCPGPGMGLYEFCRMPFGVTGGPSSFQRLMDKVLHGLPFVTSYIDDVLVHSPNMKCHLQHLQQVFERLANAGLTLRGSKCQLGLDKVHYLTSLKVNHDIISSGHQGVEKTLQRLKRTAYWIGMAKDTELYCRSCMVCQRSKLPMPTPVPMTNIPIGHPWQMLAVDVLQVPVSSRGNRYLLVIQDYFTKWAEAIPMPNQTAECIAGILIDLFSRFGIPEILHSDHGANFESTMIRRVCAAFGVLKSREQQHTTRKNDIDWEGNLPLVLYAYRTASNASTGFSPFVLMMGRDPVLPSLPSMTNSSAEDPTSYDSNLRVKMAKLRAMVESHIVQEAKRQKDHYDTRTQTGKLDPKWEGGWVVKKVHSPVTLQIEHRKSLRSRVVHINRIRRCILREKESTLSREVEWEPASIEYFSVPADSTPEPEIVPEVPPAVLPPIDLEGQEAPPTLYQAQRRYPQCDRRPPDYY
eukprot:Em0863g2a